jgi:hypothetical protein
MRVSEIMIQAAKEWKYGAQLRPASTFTLPKGFVRIEAHPHFKFGVAVYDHKLSDQDAEHFSLILFAPSSEIIDRIADKFKKYASSYVEDFSDDMIPFEVLVGDVYAKLNLYPENGKLDQKKLAVEVMNQLRKRVNP